MKIRSAAPRISARRRWPSPLALRAERRTGAGAATVKGDLPHVRFPLREPNSVSLTSVGYISAMFRSSAALDGAVAIGESPFHERNRSRGRRSAERDAHDGL